MIEKLEEYGRFLFGWAFRAMQSEMTMQESLNAKSERAYLTGTEIALLSLGLVFWCLWKPFSLWLLYPYCCMV